MQKRLYPIGRQDFPGIRREGRVYVDKTMHVFNLIKYSKYNFLSKPRRFGKSLLISTLETVFKGSKDLFEGLYIYDKWEFEEYPIIRISFSNIGYREVGLDAAIKSELQKIAENYGLHLIEEDISQKLRELILKLEKLFNKQVVLLIDEYDKPIIDYLDKENLPFALTNRGVMKTFYSVLKDADPHLKFVLITGVSKFSKVSIFSDLNNLTDLSMNPDFNEICGISQRELEENFSEELKVYDKVKIKEWYNGYKWDLEGDSVYNPFSILNFFHNKGKFENYWFATGTPTFLFEICKEQKFYDFETTEMSSIEMNSFDIENLKMMPLLYQTGYLTITDYDSLFHLYKLKFPNKEVKNAYLQGLLEVYSEIKDSSTTLLIRDLHNALKTKNADSLKEVINHVFHQLPYDLWISDKEHFYHAIVHLTFSLLGVFINSEVHTKNGRADALVFLDEEIFCLEFKLDKSANQAIQQIEERAYTEKYKGPVVHHIGINFSSEKKEVEEIVWNSFTNLRLFAKQ